MQNATIDSDLYSASAQRVKDAINKAQTSVTNANAALREFKTSLEAFEMYGATAL